MNLGRGVYWILATVLLASVPFACQKKDDTPPEQATSATQPASTQPVGPVAEVYKDWPFGTKEADRRQETTAKTLGIPRDLTLDLGNKVLMKLVLIPAGTFFMGSPDTEPNRNLDENPQHMVTISTPFYTAACQVTQEQYEQVMGRNPSSFKGATNPVEGVAWTSAVDFCKKMSALTGKSVRLPTEAEWEYACRAGTTTPLYTGTTISTAQANYNGTQVYGNGVKGEFRQKTAPVGSFKPNDFGLYDMGGNVNQWTSDWYGSYGDKPQIDPQGPSYGQTRVARGGSWQSGPWDLRSANRPNSPADYRGNDVGFRVVVGVGAGK